MRMVLDDIRDIHFLEEWFERKRPLSPNSDLRGILWDDEIDLDMVDDY